MLHVGSVRCFFLCQQINREVSASYRSLFRKDGGGEGVKVEAVSFCELIFEVAQDHVFDNYKDTPIQAAGMIEYHEFFEYLDFKRKKR